MLFPDEGHGFARPENRLAFFAVIEGFLAECLGGRAEPIGDAFEGSTVQILHGADYVDGLPEAVAAHAAAQPQTQPEAEADTMEADTALTGAVLPSNAAARRASPATLGCPT